MAAAIAVENLTKVYAARAGKTVRALDGVSFTVAEGQIFGLLGPNGAGKSTTVRILSTITTPSAGRATVRGHDVRTAALAVRKEMAVVLQQTAAETMLTVKDNLLIYAHLHGVRWAEAQARVRAIAEEFELGERLRDTVQELSIGTKRRIQVAKIFLLDTPILILDEATTGMDPFMRRRVLDRLRAEARKGRTILLTTQVLSEAEELCDTIMIIDRGRTMASGTLQDLRRRAAQMFHVSLVFSDGAGDLAARVARLGAAEISVDGPRVDLTFRGEEALLLERLAELSRATPIQQFEVRPASLEEIFVSLVGDAR